METNLRRTNKDKIKINEGKLKQIKQSTASQRVSNAVVILHALVFVTFNFAHVRVCFTNRGNVGGVSLARITSVQ